MSLLCAFTWISQPIAQGTTAEAARCWISARIELNERSGDARFGTLLGSGKRRCKKKSLRPELNWGPTG